MTEKYYKTYNLFSHIEEETLKAWNQIVTYMTVFRDLGRKEADSYMDATENRKAPATKQLLDSIRRVGLDETKRLVICGRSDNAS